MRWRYYATERRAHDVALVLVRWSPVDTMLEVVDQSVGKHLGTYHRKVNEMKFYPPERKYEHGQTYERRNGSARSKDVSDKKKKRRG